MEWLEGRITKRSVDAAEAPETRDAITELAYRADKLDLSSARERILELALKHQHSGSHVENLKAELSVSYAINRGFRQQLEAEVEANGKLSAELKHEMEENERLNAENEKLNAAVKHECKNNEKLNATLRHEREENERLNAALKCALLENANLIELIPNPYDRDPWAQSRMPMDMIVQGRSTSLFQASQQWSMMSS
jgi:hypothetical protein